MSELLKRLDRLFLKLDHTALLVEQSLVDAVDAVESGNLELAETVVQTDDEIDRREVETERECIRLLALYQPAAIDLRRICFVIKVNNDLERMADFCVNIAKACKTMKQEGIELDSFPGFRKLANQVEDAFRQTIRLFAPQRERVSSSDAGIAGDLALARSIIAADVEVIDVSFRAYLSEVLSEEGMFRGKMNALYQLTSLGRALERFGDRCTNIAEDVIFMLSGEIVRHGEVGSGKWEVGSA